MFMINEWRNCNENNAIPDDVLSNILLVYEKGKREDIAKLPNNLICLRNGDFWTTWDKVIEKRERIHRKLANRARTLTAFGAYLAGVISGFAITLAYIIIQIGGR